MDAMNKYPFEKQYPFYAMVEIASTASADDDDDEDDSSNDQERLYSFLESIENHIEDGTVAQDTN